MRKSVAIVGTTALEILSEPLSLLLLLAALALAVLAPAFHYHQFGEPTRMARDAGLSALFTCGGALAVFGTIRAFRREIESGTLEMALAHSVSRGGFFLAKTCGAFAAYLFFAVLVASVTLTIVNGAAIGGAVAAANGDIARLWGPSFTLGLATIVLPFVLGALLNRFARCRFVLSAFSVAAVLAVGAALYRFDFVLAARLLPVVTAVVVFVLVLQSAAAAFAVRWKANAAASAVGVVFAATLPFVGNYYLADTLTRGGSPSWRYVGLATLAAVPAVAAFLLLGVRFLAERDPS